MKTKRNQHSPQRDSSPGGREHTQVRYREVPPVRPKPRRRTLADLPREARVRYIKPFVIRGIDEGKAEAENDIKEAEENKAKWEERHRELNKVKEGDTGYMDTIEHLMAEIDLEKLEAQEYVIDRKREKRAKLLLKEESKRISEEEKKRLENITKEIKEHEKARSDAEWILLGTNDG